jgi:hypothetical protein
LFSTPEAARKLLYLANQNIRKKMDNAHPQLGESLESTGDSV